MAVTLKASPVMQDNYTEPEELLSDESFLSWYFKTGEGKDNSWDQWAEGHPERKALMQQAIELLKETILPEGPLLPGQIQLAETNLFNRLDELPNARNGRVIPLSHAATEQGKMPVKRRSVWIAAAVAACIVIAGGLWWGNKSEKSSLEVHTQYGQISKQELSDGTEVTLNANSHLRYNDNWKEGSDREVWMDGEAFFHVAKMASKARFIVHTDHFDIIVTGTQFNVVNRPGADNVLLKEGSVTLTCCNGNLMQMTPGDFVSFRGSQLVKGTVQSDSLMAWQDQRLIFDKTPLRDVVNIINNQYGVRVQLGDSSIGDSTISAILQNNNLEVLLKALNATSDYDVVRETDYIIIKARPHSK